MKKNVAFLMIGLLFISLWSTCLGAPKVTLKLFQFKPEITEQVHAMAKQYTKENPNVAIDVQVLQNDYEAVLRTKFNSGDAPDIFMSNGYFYNKLYLDYSYDLTKESYMKQVDPAALGASTWNGRLFGFPFLVESYAYIYNKKLFAEAGITELPKTLSQLEEACKKLQAKGIIPFGNGYRESWVFKHIFSHQMAAEGGNYQKTAEKMNKGQIKLSNLKMAMKIFDLLDMTLKYGNPKPLETDYTQQITLLATGKVAMIHQGTWAEEGIKKINPDIQLGFLPEPVGEDPSKARIMADANILYKLNKNSKNIDEARKWLKWLVTSVSGQKYIVDDCKFIPTIKGVKAPNTVLANETLSYMGIQQSYPWVQGYWPAGWETQLGSSLQAYCGGSKTKQQVMDELDKAWLSLAKAAE